MASAADLKFVLSGGAANTSPAAALGGAISTDAAAVIKSQSITASTIGGVTYDDAAGNALGNGTVTFTASGQTLQWTPPGGAIGPAVAVGTNGAYTLYGADYVGQVKVTVVAASLPGANTTQNPAIANQTNKLFDDVARAESVTGDVEYRCFYVKNTHASETMTAVKLWIHADTSGADSISVGLDPVGKNGTATTIADENAVPAGVTFSEPSDELTALDLGDLAAGDYYAVWIRRTVPLGTTDTEMADVSALKARFL